MEQEDDDYENDEDYDEESYEDEENDEEKENDFIPEFNAKDRTGKYNYDDKFVSNEDHIIKVINLLIDKLGLDEDTNYIISNINNISNIKYKNPYASLTVLTFFFSKFIFMNLCDLIKIFKVRPLI